MNLQSDLQKGLLALGQEYSPVQQEKMLAYLQLLEKWNQHFNLTSIRDPDQMLPLHLLDSLSIAGFIHGKTLLDVGTGAGLPGIPLAICYPDIRVTLLDSNGKKIRFCRQAIMELGLTNVTAEQQRIEAISGQVAFDQITTRAFTSLPNMLKLLEPVMQAQTELLAMKGQLPADEIEEIRKQGFEVEIQQLHVPFVEAERHLLIIRNTQKVR